MGWAEYALAFAAFFATHSLPVRPPLRPWHRPPKRSIFGRVNQVLSLHQPLCHAGAVTCRARCFCFATPELATAMRCLAENPPAPPQEREPDNRAGLGSLV